MNASRVLTGVVLLLLVGCSADDAPGRSVPTSGPRTTTPVTSTPVTSVASPPSSAPVAFDRSRAFDVVRALAAGIGPREATSRAYARAAALVRDRLEDLGYVVRSQPLRVPAGESWGVPVGAGRTANVVAVPPGFRADLPHLLVGAHLDTVPQAPGAEDNASGVAVLVELARMAAVEEPRLPVAFVAFAAEEPRGPGDDQHHFGSRAYVAALTSAERRALRGMVSLDRVGVGDHVRVCTGGAAPRSVRRGLLAAARRIGVPAGGCMNRTSDHWSFEKAGEAAARVGGEEYAAYHSARDRPRVVDSRQLERAGRVVWAWLVSG